MRHWLAVMLLSLFLTGCAGAKRLSFSSVTPVTLPKELSAWATVEPEVPTILAAEAGDYRYLLVSMGDCSPPGQALVVKTISRSGNNDLWVEVDFAGHKNETKPATAIVRLKRDAVEGADTSGMILQEHNMIRIDLQLGEDEAAGVRTYSPKGDYKCHEPIPGLEGK